MSFHVNPDTGRTGKCDAKIKCRFGLSQEEHFETREEAQESFEKDQGSQIGSSQKKAKASDKLWGTDIEADSIPGFHGASFAQIWKNKFKELSDVKAGKTPMPKSNVEDLLKETVTPMRARGSSLESRKEFLEEHPGYKDSISEKSEYIVCVSARQGGGNRECYCSDEENGHESGCLALDNEISAEHPNFVLDEDDNFDSTYNYMYFDNKITQKDVDEFKKEEKQAVKIHNQEYLLNKINKGDYPAWSINADEEDLSKFRTYEQTKRSVENNRERAVEAQAELKNLKKIKNAYEQDELTEEDTNKFNSVTNSHFSNNEKITINDMEQLRSYMESKKKYDQILQVKKEAENLEDNSPLKNYLLADRGTRSYRSTEGKGRNKKNVTKTYSLGSLLGEEEKSIKGSFERSKSSHQKIQEKIDKQVQSRKVIVDEYVEKKNSLNKLRDNAWATGWTGDMKDLPKPPESF